MQKFDVVIWHFCWITVTPCDIYIRVQDRHEHRFPYSNLWQFSNLFLDPTERLAAFHKHDLSASRLNNDLKECSSRTVKTYQQTKHKANQFMYR